MAADWAIKEMNNILNGKHTIRKIFNTKSQMAAGVILEFSVVTVYQSNTNNNIIEVWLTLIYFYTVCKISLLLK